MKTQTAPKKGSTKSSSKSQRAGGGARSGSKTEKAVKARSRGDAPTARKRSERSPKTENL